MLLHGFGFTPPPTGPATHLALWAHENVSAGIAAPLEVVALDGANHVVANYTGTVHFTTSDTASGIQLPADFTFSTADHGRHLFQATLATVGVQSITATDTAGSTSTDSISLNVAPAPVVTHFAVVCPETATTAQQFGVTIVALDAANHPVLNYTGTVHLSSTDSGANLPSDYTFTAADHGVHSFQVMLNTAGSQTIMATDASSNTINGQAIVNADPAKVATHLGVWAPENVTAGKPFDVVVVALDAANHPVWNYAGDVQLAAAGDVSAVLPDSYTFTPADHGFHVFHATLSTAGSQLINANDTTNSIDGSVTVTVNPAPVATHFAVYAAEKVTTGQPFNLVIVALDAANHPVPDYTGTVQLTSSDAAAAPPNSYTFTASDHGRHVLQITLKTAGAQTIIVQDASNASIGGTITVTANAPPAVTPGGSNGQGNGGLGHHHGGSDAFFSIFAGEGRHLFGRHR